MLMLTCNYLSRPSHHFSNEQNSLNLFASIKSVDCIQVQKAVIHTHDNCKLFDSDTEIVSKITAVLGCGKAVAYRSYSLVHFTVVIVLLYTAVRDTRTLTVLHNLIVMYTTVT